jgi:hypothetical protein
MSRFVEVSPDIWVNTGEGAIEMVTRQYGLNNAAPGKVELYFRSQQVTTLPNAVSIESVIEKLNDPSNLEVVQVFAGYSASDIYRTTRKMLDRIETPKDEEPTDA